MRLFFAGRPLLPVRSAGSLSLILSHLQLLISYHFILLFYIFRFFMQVLFFKQGLNKGEVASYMSEAELTASYRWWLRFYSLYNNNRS